MFFSIGVPPIAGLYWKILSKWMINEVPPFRKPPNRHILRVSGSNPPQLDNQLSKAEET